MRLKHGRGTRRNIKFDDEEETLYIDACLPDTDYWHRINPSEAKEFKTEVMGKRAADSRILLELPFTQNGSNPNLEPLGRPRNQGFGGGAHNQNGKPRVHQLQCHCGEKNVRNRGRM